MGLTTDQHDGCLHEIVTEGPRKGQQQCYLVLSEEERGKGFVRAVRRAYQHKACGMITTMGLALCETYARDPLFYGGTFCAGCHEHFDLTTPRYGRQIGKVEEWHFFWVDDQDRITLDAVGS
jgi:hypothetical protein